LETCSSLEEFYLVGTTVADGNLEPLLRIPSLREVAIARSRFHSHTAEEINAHLRGAKG
jgi:hypothetical protein